MKLAFFVAVFSLSIPFAATGQSRPVTQTRGQRGSALAPAAAAPVAEAYAQFLLAHRFEQNDEVEGAISAYKRAMDLDPLAADVPAELAALYLRQNRLQEATSAAELALKVAPANREANRVLGVMYAAMLDAGRDANDPKEADKTREIVEKAIGHLEIVLDRPVGDTDPNVRATLAKLYMRASSYDKAIPLLTDLVSHEPGWQEGPLLLVQAFSAAGRAKDAIAWLEERTPEDPRLLSSLAEFYERDDRWRDAVNAWAALVQRVPRNMDLKSRYASALLTTGAPDDLVKARDALSEIVQSRTTDTRALYLLSQAERRTGNFSAAEATARRLITLNGRNPSGYYALAQALEERREFQPIVDALAPAVAAMRARGGDNSAGLIMLLPHLGFAHRELGEHDKAIAVFEEAHRLAPKDPAMTNYLIEANIAAKKYAVAVALAKEALAGNPGDLRLALLEARALRQDGKVDEGIAVLEGVLKQRADEPAAYVALAQVYADASRGPQAVKLLQDAETRFPANTSILFQLGAVLDKQKRFADAEATFRRVLAQEPDDPVVLNYLGYMLAERGERLDESVNFLKKALEKEPYNGSYLDSLGWAYFKSDKLELAENNLRRAADQLKGNSVIQDHYGDVLFKMGRYDQAIAAWTRSLAGDGESIQRPDIDKKIRTAKQKLGKK